MGSSYIRKKTKRLKRQLREQTPLLAVALIVGLAVAGSYLSDRRSSIDPAAYRPLLDVIAEAESNGNYNAYFGNAANSKIDFTAMTIAEVLDWQAKYIDQGSASSAVGRYQILNTTLMGLVEELGIDSRQRFDKSMQDRMAIALIERRGAYEYVNDEITSEEFAANLAKEWAALPKTLGDNPERSYYAHDGINKSRIEVGRILAVIETIKP